MISSGSTYVFCVLRCLFSGLVLSPPHVAAQSMLPLERLLEVHGDQLDAVQRARAGVWADLSVAVRVSAAGVPHLRLAHLGNRPRRHAQHLLGCVHEWSFWWIRKSAHLEAGAVRVSRPLCRPFAYFQRMLTKSTETGQ